VCVYVYIYIYIHTRSLAKKAFVRPALIFATCSELTENIVRYIDISCASVCMCACVRVYLCVCVCECINT